jgi:O-acetylhomoserine (thiol)-lyase
MKPGPPIVPGRRCRPGSPPSPRSSTLPFRKARRAGAGESYVRLAPGIEHIDDILADLGQALAAAA